MSCRTHEKVRKRLLPQSPPELVGGARELRCERIKKRCAQDTPKCLKTTSAYPEKGVPQITAHHPVHSPWPHIAKRGGSISVNLRLLEHVVFLRAGPTGPTVQQLGRQLLLCHYRGSLSGQRDPTWRFVTPQ